MAKDPRSTINDKDWRNLRDRASKANPGSLFDEKATARRKVANESFKNREKN